MIVALLLLPLLALIPLPAPQRLLLALALSIMNLGHSTLMVILYDPTSSGYQFLSCGLLGLDGFSLSLVWLVTLLMPITLLSLGRVKLLTAITFWALAVFVVMDLLLFYISFEGVLIPMFFFIGFYGKVNRKIEAATSFFLYTFFGSLLLFIALLVLYSEVGHLGYEALQSSSLSLGRQKLLWLAFFLSFAIKIPMLPFHLWLIEAHVEAPTSASVLLAAILLKLGGYGFLRFSIGLFPEASSYFSPLVMAVAALGIIYASLASLAQLDMKKIVAYSSIAHMNLAVAALFSDSFTGVLVAQYFMLSHGLIAAGLFLIVGFAYDRLHTRNIKYFKGLAAIWPLFALFFLLFTFANSAVPISSGFIAEFLSFLGIVGDHPFIAVISTAAIVLTPAYALLLFHRTAYGQLSAHLATLFGYSVSRGAGDITPKELHLVALLLFFIVLLGLLPDVLFNLLYHTALHSLYSISDSGFVPKE